MSPTPRYDPYRQRLCEFLGATFILSAWLLNVLSVAKYERAQGDFATETLIQLTGFADRYVVARENLNATAAQVFRIRRTSPSFSTSPWHSYIDTWDDQAVRILWAGMMLAEINLSERKLLQLDFFSQQHKLGANSVVDQESATAHERFHRDSATFMRLVLAAHYTSTVTPAEAGAADDSLDAQLVDLARLHHRVGERLSSAFDRSTRFHATLFGAGALLFVWAKYLAMRDARDPGSESGDGPDDALPDGA
jgi:hypothetical protein